MQDAAGTSYHKLTSTFQTYTEILKKTCEQQKQLAAKPKRQATIIDMFSRAGSSK